MMNYSDPTKKMTHLAASSRLSRPILSGSAAMLGVFASIAFGASYPASALNLVANGNFAIPSAAGPTKLVTDASGGNGPSAAQGWSAFNDSAGTTTTELQLWSDVPGGKMNWDGYVIHVTTSSTQAGIFQKFASTGPSHVYTCDLIYINSGAVGIGTGFGTHTAIDATLSKTGSWEVLNVGNTFEPAINTITYSQNGPADFYVKSVSVSDSHDQCNPS
jgi:predicted RecA/RadA family phage recombinase